jgi:hypothetical protein
MHVDLPRFAPGIVSFKARVARDLAAICGLAPVTLCNKQRRCRRVLGDNAASALRL